MATNKRKPLSCCSASLHSKRKEHIPRLCLTKKENARIKKLIGTPFKMSWRGVGKKKKVIPIE